MTTRRFTNVSILFFSIIALLFFSLAAHSVEPATRSQTADLAQIVEELTTEVKHLRKQVQALSDLLDDLTAAHKKAVAATPAKIPVPTSALATTSKLRSPRQIDRIPILEEKTKVLLAKLQASISMPEATEPLTKLLTTKNQSNFVQSLKTQLTEWLDTPSADRSFDSPFSPKQFAWVQYLMFPGEYDNPKSNKELYPNG